PQPVLPPQPAARKAPAPAAQPGVFLREIRDFQVSGKQYVFVVPVTAVFEVGSLAGEILRLLRPADFAPVAATEAIQVPETRSASLSEILTSLGPRHPRQQIVDALKELRGIGAVQLVGFRDEGLPEPTQLLPPVPFPQKTLVLNVA